MAFPLYVDLGVRGPFLVDLEEDGAGEPQQRVLAGKDPDLDGSALELLLDRTLDQVGRAEALAVVLGQRAHGQPLGHVLFQPICQLRCAVAITGNQVGERGLGLGQIVGRPDGLELPPDALGRLGVERVVDGVAGEMELAALPGCTSYHGVASPP